MAFYKSLLVVSLAACVCLAGASAQEPQATQPDRAGGRLGVPQPLGNIVRADEVIERRYKVEAISFKAVDESGYDWDGSDEVVIETIDAKGGTSTREIGDMDSGDVHHFDPAKSCIVAVREGQVLLGENSVCTDAGEPAPFWAEIWFYENDPDCIPLCEFFHSGCAIGAVTDGEEFPPGKHCSPRHTIHADFLGASRVEYSQQDLDARLPNVGDQYENTVRLDPCYNGTNTSVCGVPSWPLPSYPDYDFTYRITRLPDVRYKLGK